MDNLAKFWALIADCRKSGGDDLLGMTAAWEYRLGLQSSDEMRQTTLTIMEVVESMATWDVFAAAWLFTEGNRDDFMLRFCEWVICHGEKAVEACIQDPESVPSLNLMNGRWHEGKLSALARHAAMNKFGEAWYARSDHVLWWPVVGRLKVDIDPTESTSIVCSRLKDACPIRPEELECRFPKLTEFCNSRKVLPGLDRRTPMTFEKFWSIVEEARIGREHACFFEKALETLPGGQIVEFDAILDDLSNKASKALSSKFGDKTSEAALVFITLGKHDFERCLANPEFAQKCFDQAEFWRADRLRKAAKSAFFEKTGHSTAA